MQTLFKTRFRRLALWAAAAFIIMFLFRLLYGYAYQGVGGSDLNLTSDYFDGLSNLRRNYASEKLSLKESGAVRLEGSPNPPSNQKYEKTASLRSQSADFENDARKIRQATESFRAIVQYEQAMGLKGKRELHLMIGVNPAAFDSFYMAMQKIGDIKANEITKVDKTNEYRQLNAKKASLEKTLASLMELKSRGGGAISDLVGLHDKIMEIESLMQELGVELGNFNTENEFCTVKLSIYEGKPAATKDVSFMQRAKVALEWTLKWYLVLMAAIAFASLSILFIIYIADKLKIISLKKD
ncbi:DUF4349 domain-containing protein [uncultured Chitinophaga sp.]|uniref:DUF4349 domain-containing protein n=1 Tax=uncultured Chitinophaga sp. TaxID=339340 RepID=UPI0025FC874A|nr:DUF4349 domain-containing protein [uncultured Chitinophaga sp.]